MSGGPELFSGESHLGLAVMVFRALNVGRLGKAQTIAYEQNDNGHSQNESDNPKPEFELLIDICKTLKEEKDAHPDHQELDRFGRTNSGGHGLGLDATTSELFLRQDLQDYSG